MYALRIVEPDGYTHIPEPRANKLVSQAVPWELQIRTGQIHRASVHSLFGIVRILIHTNVDNRDHRIIGQCSIRRGEKHDRDREGKREKNRQRPPKVRLRTEETHA